VVRKSALKKILLALAFLASLALVAAPGSSAEGSAKAGKEKLKQAVAAMEDAFSAMAQTKGLLAAFEYFTAPDVAFLDTDPRKFRGPAAVRERMGTDQPGPGPDGNEIVRGGWFLTIWKRQPNGTWRYVMDNGAPDRPPAPPPAAKKN
jgi:ketosteroid isomerase-like protein